MPTGPLFVALDWTPNTNHAGLALAATKGWFADAGLDVKLLSPHADGYEATPASHLVNGSAHFACVPSESVIRQAGEGRCGAAGANAAAARGAVNSSCRRLKHSPSYPRSLKHSNAHLLNDSTPQLRHLAGRRPPQDRCSCDAAAVLGARDRRPQGLRHRPVRTRRALLLLHGVLTERKACLVSTGLAAAAASRCKHLTAHTHTHTCLTSPSCSPRDLDGKVYLSSVPATRAASCAHTHSHFERLPSHLQPPRP